MSGEQTSWQRLEVGTVLNGRYRILRIIGKGGMGTVYMAEHMHLDSTVAIKEVRLPKTNNPEQDEKEKEACIHEARVLVQLHHPHLPKVTDAFIENDRFYLVMEYIEGVTLEAFLRNQERTPLDVAKVVSWGIQIADVLDYLHRQEPPIIFRDLKPSNVMLRADGSICLIDFGIARRFQPGATRDTALLGSVGYSPPEQFGKRQTDMRSDIYALGATLHHLLTGYDPASQPFKFPPVRSLNPSVPESLERLIAACVALEPEARPQTALEVREALERIHRDLLLSTSLSIGSKSSPLAEQSGSLQGSLPLDKGRRASAYPIVAGALGLIGAIAVVGAIIASTHRSPHKITQHPSMAPSSVPALPSYPYNVPSMPTVNPLSSAPIEPTVPPSPIDTSSIQLAAQQAVMQPGGMVLPLTISGNIVGHMGVKAIIAVYFYQDEKGTMPLNAAVGNTIYATSNGQLSMAAQMDVPNDPQPFTWNALLPLKQIPVDAVSQGRVYARAELLIDGKRICISPMVNLTSYLPPVNPTTPTQNGSTLSYPGAGSNTSPYGITAQGLPNSP